MHLTFYWIKIFWLKKRFKRNDYDTGLLSLLKKCTFPKVFPKCPLPKCAISQMATYKSAP